MGGGRDSLYEALVVWEPTQHPNRYEAMAGRAVALLHLDGQEEAVQLVHAVIEFVATQDLVGIVEPVLLLLNCATVLTACAEPAQAAAVYQRAHGWVQTVASRISDETVRAAFLARPDQQQLKSRLASTPTYPSLS